MLNIIKTYLIQMRVRRKSAEQIASIQEKNFRSLLHHAVNHSPFYRRLYQNIDITSCSITDLPIVTRNDMLQHFDEIVTDSQLKQVEIEEWMNDLAHQGNLYKQRYVPMKTSGSSGQKLLVVYDLKGLNVIHTSLLARLSIPRLTKIRAILGGLVGRPLKIATLIMTKGMYPAVSAAKYKTATHKLFSDHRVISSDQSCEDMVKALNEFQPDILYTYAGVLEILAQEQIEGRLQLDFQGDLSTVLSMSELLTPRARKLAKQAWGLVIDNTYAAAECLVMGRTCEEQTMHLMSDVCLLEAVDGSNQVVDKGEFGKKVLMTNLFNYAQPFIRYELQDITGLSASTCSCGSPFPSLLPIQGRSSDNLLVRNNEDEISEVRSNIFIAELYRLDCLQDYQIRQTEYNLMVCYYVPVKEAQEDCEQALNKALSTAIQLTGMSDWLSYQLKCVDTIPRHEVSGKRQLIVSMDHLSVT